MEYLSITFIRNNFPSISHLIDNNLDILAIAEKKLVSSFPESQFILPGMKKPIRFDVTSRKGGLLVFFNNDIPSKYLRSFYLLGDIQTFPLEIKQKQRKLLVVCIYRSPDQNFFFFVIYHLITILKVLQKFLSKWVLLMQMEVIQ